MRLFITMCPLYRWRNRGTGRTNVYTKRKSLANAKVRFKLKRLGFRVPNFNSCCFLREQYEAQGWNLVLTCTITVCQLKIEKHYSYLLAGKWEDSSVQEAWGFDFYNENPDAGLREAQGDFMYGRTCSESSRNPMHSQFCSEKLLSLLAKVNFISAAV